MKAQEIIKSIRYDGIKLTHLKTLSASVDEMDNPKTIDFADSDDFMIIILLNRLSKIKLTLSQFVPCGADGKPLEKPCEHDGCYLKNIEEAQAGVCAAKSCTCKELKAYHKAQKNVIFEGWEALNHMVIQNKVTKDKFMFILAHGELRIWFDKFEHKDAYLTLYIGKNPTLADLAAATISNPIKFK